MSADSKLSTTNLKFTDTSSNVGKMSFGSDVFTIDKTTNFSAGINVTGISVSSGSVSVSSQDTLKLAGSTSGELTLQAAATTTDYTLTMPSAQGSASTVLTNDGSGNLSWGSGGGGSSSSSSTSSYMRAVVDVDTTNTTDYQRYDGDDFRFSSFTSYGDAISYAQTGSQSSSATAAGTVFTLAANKTYHISFTTTDAAGNTFDIVHFHHNINGSTVLKQMVMPTIGGDTSDQFVNQGSVQFVYKTGSSSENYVVNVYDAIGQSYFNPRADYTALSIVELNSTTTSDVSTAASFIRATVSSDGTDVQRDPGDDIRFDSFTSYGSGISYAQTGLPSTPSTDRGTIFTLSANKTYMISFFITERASNDFDYCYLHHYLGSTVVVKQLILPVSGYTGDYVNTPTVNFTYRTGSSSEEYKIRVDTVSGGSGTLRPRNDSFTHLSITELPGNSGADFTGASSSAAGASGLVPQPTSGQNNYLLLGNGSWTSPNPEAILELFGTERLYWDGRTDPTAGSPAISLPGDEVYYTGSNYNNQRIILLVNGANQNSYVNFDAGASYSNWKFEVYYRILNTSNPADRFYVFGQGTQTNSGDESNTGGLTYATDYYNSNTHVHRAKIDIYNGSTYTTLQDYTETRMDDVFDNYNKLTMIRYGSDIIVKTESYANGLVRFKVSSSQSLSGQRWGLGGVTGSEWMQLEIKTLRLVTLD